MNDIKPSMPIIVIAAAVIGFLVAIIGWWPLNFRFFGGILLGLVFAWVTFAVLWYLWREELEAGHVPQTAPQSATAAVTPAATDTAPSPQVADPANVTPDVVVAADLAVDKDAPPKDTKAETAALPEPKPETPAEPAAVTEAAAELRPDPVVEIAPEIIPEIIPETIPEIVPEIVPEPAPESAPIVAPVSEEKPTFMAEARDGTPDDLQQIKGIGPKLEQTLHGMGVFHFDQIADWGPAEQAWIDDNLKGFKGRATRDDWVAQAKTLAAGRVTG